MMICSVENLRDIAKRNILSEKQKERKQGVGAGCSVWLFQAALHFVEYFFGHDTSVVIFNKAHGQLAGVGNPLFRSEIANIFLLQAGGSVMFFVLEYICHGCVIPGGVTTGGRNACNSKRGGNSVGCCAL